MKIALITPRYGKEVNGGAELLARMIAKHLAEKIDVDIITTKAVDYMTWADYYNKDLETIENVHVRRFNVDSERDIKEFNRLTQEVYLRKNVPKKTQVEWLKKQGPYSSALIDYVNNNHNKYDFILLIPYLYATTYFTAMLDISTPLILIPAAHDESPFYLPIIKDILNRVSGIIYSTVEEKELVEEAYRINVPNKIIGSGLEIEDFNIKKKKVNDNYILYMGRIEEGKGVNRLFRDFITYKRKNKNNVKLYLIGKAICDIPRHRDIKYLGYVSVKEKYQLIKDSSLIINPSKYESLSLIILEAWRMKKSVLVNAESPVLLGQCLRSNGGLWYSSYLEFEGCLNWFNKNLKHRKKLGKNGYRYYKNNYTWKIIVKKYLDFFQDIG